MGDYSKILWQHFNEPRNVGRIEDADAEGFAGGRRAGPFFRFTARLKGEVIEEVQFQTFGCAPAIAAGSFLSEAVRGKTLAEAAAWDVDKLSEALGGLPEDKIHCAVLAVTALFDLIAKGRRVELPRSELT